MSSLLPMQPTGESHYLFRLINDAHSPFGDMFFGIVTGLGDGLVISLLCSLLILFHMRAGIASLGAFIISGLVAQLLKRMFDMPRPPAILENVHVLGHALTSHSFPSGHSTSDGVMVLLAFIIWSRADWRSWSIATLFVLAAIGRVYVGVHFPIDVIAGLAIGMVTMWLCWKWSARLPVDQWLESPWSWKIPALIVSAQAAVLGLGYHVQPATAQSLALLLPVFSLLLMAKVCKQRLANE